MLFTTEQNEQFDAARHNEFEYNKNIIQIISIKGLTFPPAPLKWLYRHNSVLCIKHYK